MMLLDRAGAIEAASKPAAEKLLLCVEQLVCSLNPILVKIKGVQVLHTRNNGAVCYFSSQALKLMALTYNSIAH